MGNGHSGPRLLNSENYNIKLDNGASSISMRNGQNRNEKKEWELTYGVNGMTCKLSISRISETSSNDERLEINVSDCSYVTKPDRPHPRQYIILMVEKVKDTAGYVKVMYTMNKNEATKYGESRRGEVEEQFWTYGDGTRLGLFVTGKKKKSSEELPYSVTLAHFRASSANIGLSILVKIEVRNGKLEFWVDGPVQHLSSKLRGMIEDVFYGGTWERSACLHRQNIRQLRTLLSESEDSDTTAQRQAKRRGGSYIENQESQFSGHGNGSIIKADQVNIMTNNCKEDDGRYTTRSAGQSDHFWSQTKSSATSTQKSSSNKKKERNYASA